jgi:hypothetical protein
MGEGGLIQYKSKGFLDRIPFAVGLYNENLSLANPNWKNGFMPIFERGSAINDTRELDEKTAFLIHPDLEELQIYVDHLDGSAPKSVGFIDFKKPLEGPSDPAVFEQGASTSDAKFRIKIQLLPTRQLIATNLTTGKIYGMVLDKTAWVTEENPFAGVH